MFFTRFSPPPSPGEINASPTMTQQHYKDECDLNQILARHKGAGELSAIQMRQLLAQSAAVTPTSPRLPQFADYSNLPDFSEIKRSFIKASRAFAEVPVNVRMQFGNNPEIFYNVLTDPKQHQRLRDAGLGFLLSEKKEPETAPVESAQDLT